MAATVPCSSCKDGSCMLCDDNGRVPLVDPGWECDRCGHVNDDAAEECAGPKCVSFREWAATQAQTDDEKGR